MDHLLYRILNGYNYLPYKDSKLKVYSPTLRLLHRASSYLEEVALENAYDERHMYSSFAKQLLLVNRIIPFNVEEVLETIAKEIEELKIDMFMNYTDAKRLEAIRTRLRLTENKQEDYQSKLHSFDHLTLEGYLNFVKYQYLLSKTIYYKGKRYLDNVSMYEMDKVVSIVNRVRISIKEYRQLARDDGWRSYYNSVKKSPFKNIQKVTEEQRYLLSFTHMYDSAYKSSDCPSDVVIQDDDIFDGWLLVQRKKYNETQQNNEVDQLLKSRGVKDGGEVFITTKDREYADKINSMNTTQSKIIKQQRSDVINKHGKAEDKDFHDVKVAKQQQTTQALASKFKQK